MLTLKAIKTEGNIEKGKEYYMGGLYYNSDNLALLDKDKKVISGNYDCTSCFGITREEVLKRIDKVNEDIKT